MRDHFSSETHTQKPVRFSLALCINSPLTKRPFPRDQKSFARQIETWYKWFPKGEETGIYRKDFVVQMVSTNAVRWSLAGQKSGANGDRRLIRIGHLRNRCHTSGTPSILSFIQKPAALFILKFISDQN